MDRDGVQCFINRYACPAITWLALRFCGSLALLCGAILLIRSAIRPYPDYDCAQDPQLQAACMSFVDNLDKMLLLGLVIVVVGAALWAVSFVPRTKVRRNLL